MLGSNKGVSNDHHSSVERGAKTPSSNLAAMLLEISVAIGTYHMGTLVGTDI